MVVCRTILAIVKFVKVQVENSLRSEIYSTRESSERQSLSGEIIWRQKLSTQKEVVREKS